MIILATKAAGYLAQDALRKFGYRASWMKTKERKIIVDLLTAIKPIRCLEWGTGYSTLNLPKSIPKDAEWLSIEHDEGWAKKVSAMNKRPATNILIIKPDNKNWYTHKYDDGKYEDFISYIERPSDMGKFNFVFVDGRARNEAIKKAAEIMPENGIIVLHDVNRMNYRKNLHLFENQELFTDYRKGSGGLWIGSKGRKIRDVLDVDKYRKIWKISDGLERVTSRPLLSE